MTFLFQKKSLLFMTYQTHKKNMPPFIMGNLKRTDNAPCFNLKSFQSKHYSVALELGFLNSVLTSAEGFIAVPALIL